MNHQYWEDLTIDYEDGVLDPQTTALFEEHLKGCTECQTLLSFSVERDALREWYQGAPSISVEGALAARIAGEPERGFAWMIREFLPRMEGIPRVSRWPIALVPILTAAAIAVALLIMLGDSGGLSPNGAVVQAYENILSLNTLRYNLVEERLDCPSGEETISSGLSIEDQCAKTATEARGEVVFPDSWHEMPIPSNEATKGQVHREILVVNGQTYIKSDTGWVQREDHNLRFPLLRLFPTETLDLLTKGAISFEEMSEEPIDGAPTDHYRVEWQDDQDLRIMEVWIGKDDHLPRKIYWRIEALGDTSLMEEPPIQSIDGYPVLTMLTKWNSQTYVFFDFNASITLEKPNLYSK